MSTTSKPNTQLYNIQITEQQAQCIWHLLLKDRKEWVKFEEKFFLERGKPCFEILDTLDDIDDLLKIFNVPDQDDV